MSNLRDLDDVDDDVFISKKPQNYIFEEKKANDIQERTSRMMQNTRALVEESEQIGQSTLENLSTQRETLERVENDLDNINSMTRYTQKQLKNMRSFFGGFKSIFGNKDQQANQPPSIASRLGIPRSATTANVTSSASDNSNSNNASVPSRNERPSFPNVASGLASSSGSAARQQDPPADEFEENLSEIGFGLGRLRDMAMKLGNEIGDQNEIVDRITEKSERAGDSITHQNRQMQQILKKS